MTTERRAGPELAEPGHGPPPLETREAVLVDAEYQMPEQPQELMTPSEAADLQRLMGNSTEPGVDISKLTISTESLRLIREARDTFSAASDGDPAERILEELVVGEVGLGHELQNLEAAAISFLGKTLDRPELAVEVARVAREVVGLSSAVRRRTENSLSAIAGLRAQRVILAAQRGRAHG